ncbi:MAG: hypothetical protein AAFP03_17765, partial [Cyanobacteria bacterium J06598_3]
MKWTIRRQWLPMTRTGCRRQLMAIIRRRSWAIALTTCFICLILSGSPFSTGPVTATVLTAPVAQTVEAALARLSPGLTLEKVGTPEVYFSRQGKPLLSFGGMSDFIFYAAPDAFDYERWADWAAGHGMNHVRAYPPMSWRFIEKFARDNGGLPDNLRFPYRETSPGSRQFDLSQFDEAYWQRFRQQCEYLQSKGIVIHLLMVNGWQLEDNDRNWGGHFFNPDNNINSFTDALPFFQAARVHAEDNRVVLWKLRLKRGVLRSHRLCHRGNPGLSLFPILMVFSNFVHQIVIHIVQISGSFNHFAEPGLLR